MNLLEALETGEWITRSNITFDYFYKKQNDKIMCSVDIHNVEMTFPLSDDKYFLNAEAILADDWVPVTFDAKQIRLQNLITKIKLSIGSFTTTLDEICAK